MAAAEQRYIDADVNTASPLRLVLITYDVALSNLSRASDIDSEAERVDFNGSVSRARQAVLTLIEGLDYSKSPELASSLGSLYAYLFRRLTDAITDNDATAVSEAYGHLSELRSAWQQLMDEGHGEVNRAAAGRQGRIVSVVG